MSLHSGWSMTTKTLFFIWLLEGDIKHLIIPQVYTQVGVNSFYITQKEWDYKNSHYITGLTVTLFTVSTVLFTMEWMIMHNNVSMAALGKNQVVWNKLAPVPCSETSWWNGTIFKRKKHHLVFKVNVQIPFQLSIFPSSTVYLSLVTWTLVGRCGIFFLNNTDSTL